MANYTEKHDKLVISFLSKKIIIFVQLNDILKRLFIMRLQALFTLLLAVFTTSVVGQSEPNSPQRMKLVKVEQTSKSDQVASLELNIKQIESKILFIKNNPVLLREAENAGYLLELDKLKQVSKEKLKLLQK